MSNKCCCDSNHNESKTNLTRNLHLLLSSNEFISREEQKITPTEMWILTLLICELEKQDFLPIIKNSSFNKKLNLSIRQIQRTLLNLETKGYISRISGHQHKTQLGNAYELTGILDLLKKIDSYMTKFDKAA